MIVGSLTATCTTTDPMSTHATARCTRTNENDHGYHWKMLNSPVTSWKIAVATSTATDPRSIACRGPRSRGRWNSAGYVA